ncbi:rhodanese-like domain-containing protein [Pararhodonellum marinum]|uniref:rhodanese-like domain-containing protein n=1 Tax=Pararhodonellum marinum TaxID=2755358 RepID=UPI00188F3D36|nr:rhodanese-like domain-containing protein [Pararhodonellum marinum]
MFNIFKSKPKAYQNVSAEDFHKEMGNKGTVLIDVRSAGEFGSGKIKGARNLDVMRSDFNKQIQHLDKDKTYLLYCRSGNRSGQACAIMAEAGFTQLKNLNSGLMGWPYELV